VLSAAPDQAGKARLIVAAARSSVLVTRDMAPQLFVAYSGRVTSWSTSLHAAHLCLWSVS